MGKQISYYMEQDSFLEIVQFALDSGCTVFIQSRGCSISQFQICMELTEQQHNYLFYFLKSGRMRKKWLVKMAG